jgi:hypothetical protein
MWVDTVYGSEGWEFESLRARHRTRRSWPYSLERARFRILVSGSAVSQFLTSATRSCESGQARPGRGHVRMAAVLIRAAGQHGAGDPARDRQPGDDRHADDQDGQDAGEGFGQAAVLTDLLISATTRTRAPMCRPLRTTAGHVPVAWPTARSVPGTRGYSQTLPPIH